MDARHFISVIVAVVVAALAVAPAAAAEEAPAEGTPPSGFHENSFVDTSGTGTIKAQRMQVEGGGGGICYGRTIERADGGWPYRRRLYNYTVWCASGGLITYRSTSAWTHHDFMCWNESGPHVARTAGGAGWTYVQVQVWTYVRCHTPFWFDAHDTLMQRVNYYPNGVWRVVAYD